jgi:prepilin-type N-terminal cleavage/methylation domain-containing protein
MRTNKPNRVHENGFTLIEIMIVVAIIGLLAAIAIPNYTKARQTTRMTVCIRNLQQIDFAVQSWALEKGKEAGIPVTYTDISSYLRNSVVCPAGGTSFSDSYQISSVDVQPVCLRSPSGEYPHRMPL